MHYVGNRVEWQNGICAPACPKHHGSIKDAQDAQDDNDDDGATRHKCPIANLE